MGECWNIANAGKLAPMEGDFMEKQELRAIANYFRNFHGADSFLTALAHARSLSDGGELETATVWNQIAEEISQIETNDTLARCLKRGPD
jgi:hypothetical protein